MSTKPYDQAFKFLAEQDPQSLLRLLGAQFGQEIEAVGNPIVLQRLSHELDDIPDPDTLRQRLAELAAIAQSPLPPCPP
jgi:hypothetical protein